MKTSKKQAFIYILVLVGGVLIGKFLWSGSSAEKASHEHHEHSEMASDEVWTCSMHPEIREDQPGDCPICGMDLTLMDEEDSSLDPKAIKMSPRALALAKVATAFPSDSPGESKSLTLDGKLLFNEENKKKLTADFHGRIDEFYVDYEGQQVNKGQVIAELYSPEIENLQRELLIAHQEKDENPRLFNASVKKLKNWNISQQDIDEILASGEIINRIKIRSPFEGIVSNLSVRKGNHVERGDLLFEVNDISQLWGEFEAYEQHVSKINLGDSIYFTSRAFPGKKWGAKVNFISPTMNDQKRSFQVRADVKNPDLKLKPSFIVRGEVKTQTSEASAENGLWVPQSAVLWTGKKSVVYVQVSDDDSVGFLMKPVEIGRKTKDFVEVLEGIEASDEVAVSGVFSIDAAAQIAAKPSMMNTREKKGSSIDVDWKEVRLETEAFSAILNLYLQLKEDLADDEEEKALTSAKKLQQKTEDLNIQNQEAKKGLVQLSKDVSKSKNIDVARENFQFLSDALIALMDKNNPSDQPIYLQYCPMADNDQGAFWLSEEAVIKNPYFGSMMLKCGSVEGEF